MTFDIFITVYVFFIMACVFFIMTFDIFIMACVFFIMTSDIFIMACVFFIMTLVGWLVGFYGISTFVGYLTPNPFLWK